MKRFFLKVVFTDGTVVRTRILANEISDLLLGLCIKGVTIDDFSKVRCFTVEEVH